MPKSEKLCNRDKSRKMRIKTIRVEDIKRAQFNFSKHSISRSGSVKMNSNFFVVLLLVCLISQNKAQHEIMDRLNRAMKKTVAEVKDTYTEVESKVSNFYNEVKSKLQGNDEKLAENMWRTVNEMYRLREDINDFREEFRNFQQNNEIREISGEIQELRFAMSRANQKQQDLFDYYKQNNAMSQGKAILRELSHIHRQIQDIKIQQQKLVNCTNTHNKVQVDNYWRPNTTTTESAPYKTYWREIPTTTQVNNYWGPKNTTADSTGKSIPLKVDNYWRPTSTTTESAPHKTYWWRNDTSTIGRVFPEHTRTWIFRNYNENEETNNRTEVPYWRPNTSERNIKNSTSRYWRFTVSPTTIPPMENTTDNSEKFTTEVPYWRPNTSERNIKTSTSRYWRLFVPLTTVPPMENTTDNSEKLATRASFYPWKYEGGIWIPTAVEVETRTDVELTPTTKTPETTEEITSVTSNSDDRATYSYNYDYE